VHSSEPARVEPALDTTDRRILTSWGGRSVMIRRTLDASVGQVWAAVSSAERLAAWLGPVTGRLEVGSVVDFAGAVIQIVECRPPLRLELRWTLMGETNDLRLELRALTHGCEVTVEHGALVNPAAVGYGPSWEERLIHLAEHLDGRSVLEHDCASALARVQPLWWALLQPEDRLAMGLPG
jgi:uncharacterized protein YndB with AHSA1/START domain